MLLLSIRYNSPNLFKSVYSRKPTIIIFYLNLKFVKTGYALLSCVLYNKQSILKVKTKQESKENFWCFLIIFYSNPSKNRVFEKP